MKRVVIFFLLTIACLAHAQELPTIPANGFAFSLGTKFTIKLIPTDPDHYDYSVLTFETFHEIIDTNEKEKLFEEKGEDNTVVCYFCVGTHGETEEEKNNNMRVLLIMKSFSKETLSYTSDIQTEEEGEYEGTSNVGIFPGAIMMEIWPYMIYSIGLRDFRKYGSDPISE